MSIGQTVLFSGCGFVKREARVVDTMESYVLVEVEGLGYYLASPEEVTQEDLTGNAGQDTLL